MSQPETSARERVAWDIVDRCATGLFINGLGRRADRLVLTVDVDANTKRDLGGWCHGAVRDRIKEAIDSALLARAETEEGGRG